jgi:hypothetical protein
MDFANRDLALAQLAHIPAAIEKNGEFVRHNSGVYFQNIPINPFTELASIPYQEAEKLGYIKLDFLNNTIYSGVRDGEHLEELRSREPVWDLLCTPDFVDMLAHVRGHFDIVDTIKPRSVMDLAVCLALIRPGKRHLLNKSRTEIDQEIWVPPTDGAYHFKRAHAVAYAVTLVVQMNLIVEQALESSGSE